MKFSVIVPIYNVEKYLDRCLKSIMNQTYTNYEVILVNDGSKDNSQNIIDQYVSKDKRFKSFMKENGGLSDARNYGLKYITGDYVYFLDSDDFIENNLFENVNNVLNKNKIDVLKFNFNLVNDIGDYIDKENPYDKEGIINYQEIMSFPYVEVAWSYFYKASFWKGHNFLYEVGKLHEDFGLTPYVLYSAKEIYYLNYYGYNYVQREGSIISTNTREKCYKKAYDTLYHFDNLIKKVEKDCSHNKQVYLSFLANGVINRIRTLYKEDRKNYINELKKRKVYKYLMDDTIVRKIKKYLLKSNIDLYLLLTGGFHG